jgi:ABC-type Fe3+/spermidine/putrescine transport system ATPase subunit
LHNGQIIQTGTPDEVFRNPVSKFVARYAGIRNFYKVKFVRRQGVCRALCGNTAEFIISDGDYPDSGLIIIRSDAIKIHSECPEDDSQNCLKGIVSEVFSTVYGKEITVDAGERFYVDLTREEYIKLQIHESSDVWITFPGEAAVALSGSV